MSLATLTYFVPLLGVLCSALPSLSVATQQEYPDVIPGPGLPSLESLNLTSEILWNGGKLLDTGSQTIPSNGNHIVKVSIDRPALTPGGGYGE
ncbi:hypothetical protein N0V90_005409 [Kalmusia sp. IMI 367209]|nr:hypothetical protein N0V90_005409 [Kalmusia sp. IMI 367209]